MNQIGSQPDLRNKKVLFLAETNYQIINCINLACHAEGERCDLYICKLYPDTEELAERIRALSIFDKVAVYNDEDSGKLSKAIIFAFLERYIHQFLGNFDYDLVFFASRNFTTRCIVTYVKYHRPDVTLIAYDEGLGTYISKMEGYTNSVERLLVRLKYRNQANMITDKVLYLPQAYMGDGNDIRLYTMPPIDQRVLSLVNDLFRYRDEMQINKRFVFFDGYFDGKDERTIHVLQSLVDKCGQQLVVKAHPQTPDGVYPSGDVYPLSGLPYEVIAANDKQLEEKVLITSISTAVWTPLLLFRKMPRVILLYPIFGVKEVEGIIEKMISFYDTDKITIIHNYDELKTLIL